MRKVCSDNRDHFKFNIRIKSEWNTTLAILSMALAFFSILGSAFLSTYLYLLVILLAVICPILVIVKFARHRLHAAISVGLMLMFFIIIALVPLGRLSEGITPSDAGALVLVMTILAWISPLILLSVAPAKAVSRRLIFLAIGLVLLIVLNELSKLGLDVTAPKLQG
jgi:hypothetical protein